MAPSRSIQPRHVIEDLAGERQEGLAFVLQPMTRQFDAVLASIKSAGEAKGLTVRRADDIMPPGPLMTQVVDGICKAEVVIADLTGRNANVFYEMGIGHAIREDMILLTQDVKSVPFDLQHLRLIEYNKEHLDQLKTDLAATIDEVLLLPPEARGAPSVGTTTAADFTGLLAERNLVDLNRADFGTNEDSRELLLRNRNCTVECHAFVVLSLVPQRRLAIDPDAFWRWVEGRRRAPHILSPFEGEDIRPRGQSLLVRRRSEEDRTKLTRYTLFDESGYIEWGRALGGCEAELCVVRLTPLLAAVQRLIDIRQELASDFPRPTDTLVVSVANAGGTALSHLGKGWLEPWVEFRSYAPRCEDAHIQRRFMVPDPSTNISFIRQVDAWINRCYGHDGPRGFNHPEHGDPDLLAPDFVNRDPWER